MRPHVIAAAVALCAGAALLHGDDAVADGPLDRYRPSIGYAYPAGGRAGTVFDVVLGGQNLRGVVAAHVSGEGVKAAVLRSVRALSQQQQRELVRRVAAERKRRRDVAAAAAAPRGDRKRDRARGRKADRKDAAKANTKQRIELPRHPLLDDLTVLSEGRLDDVLTRFVGPGRKKQPNVQLAQMVELSVEIARDTPPGWREIRLETRAGLTNPVRFRVGDLPEVCERESPVVPVQDLTARELPLLVNGQLLAGDVDRFRFWAARGQRLLIEAEARSLVPFLADAVPGWFQAVVRVRMASGREVAFSDDFDFDPDPRLVLDIPADGDYVVEIYYSIHRGREDFVYRLSLREDARKAWTPSPGDAPPGLVAPARVRERATPEVEPNDDLAHAEDALLPVAVRGTIGRPGDKDVFVFEGRAGAEIVIEVEARRMLSPLDGVVRLVDPSGEVIAWSDDHDSGDPGLLTHDADPYLRVRLPHDGAYAVEVSDVCGHGGVRSRYRLRIGPPLPDFDLVVSPSGVSVPAGRTVPVTVHAVRHDGFDGAIDLSLTGESKGFSLSGGRIPSGADSVRVTLSARPDRRPGVIALGLAGRARIGAEDVVRQAVPADDRLQAFILRELVPAQEWLVAVTRSGRRGAPPVTIASELPVVVPRARNARIDLRVPGLSAGTVLELRLDNPPDGIALDGWEVTAGRITAFVKADPERVRGPLEDNLIVEVWTTVKKRRTFVGHLPAIWIRAGVR